MKRRITEASVREERSIAVVISRAIATESNRPEVLEEGELLVWRFKLPHPYQNFHQRCPVCPAAGSISVIRSTVE